MWHGDGLTERQVVVEKLALLLCFQREFRIGEDTDQLGGRLSTGEGTEVAGAIISFCC